MKIQYLEIKDFQPIKYLKLDNLGNTIIIAGANGAGKTRLKQAIVQTLQGSLVMNMTIAATRAEEEDSKYFGGKTLVIQKDVNNPVLSNYINSRKYGAGRYVGSLVQIDSDRSIRAINYSPVNWFGADPDDSETPANFYFSAFFNRWNVFMNYIHQKAASRDKKIADAVKGNPSKAGNQILKEYPDPLEKYQLIFRNLLPGKELQNINPASPSEFTYIGSSGEPLPFSSLSSGEQEVVKVVFDFISKEIRHSVIIVDEPELHLHPTLTFKLIETLKQVGDLTNQFIFLTHSADLISTYYSTGDVYFIDAIQTGANQAHKLSDLNHSHNEVVQLIGQNIGLFAVGKKLIFIEGEESSIDRLAYHTIVQTIIPEAKVVPVGSVTNILTLNVLEQQIRSSIFGINIYMIRDRDGLNDTQIMELEKNGRIKCLKRRHIENYFLDPEILFKVAQKLYLTATTPTITKEFIETEINRIVAESVNFNLLKNTKEHLAINHFFKIPTVKNLDSKTSDQIKDEIVAGINSSLGELSTGLNETEFRKWLNKEEVKLKGLIQNGNWQTEFQGKIIFSKICSDVLKEDSLRVRQAYVDIALTEKPQLLDDIINILKGFSTP